MFQRIGEKIEVAGVYRQAQFIPKKLKLDFPAALPRGTLKEGAETLGFCDN